MAKRLTSLRISEYTDAQIQQLGQHLQANNTEIVLLAIDRMYKQEFGSRNPLESQNEAIEQAKRVSASRDEHPVYIYALCDPGTSTIRYIGKTLNPETRVASHLYGHRTQNGMNPCSRWIRDLRAKGLRPDLLILEKTTDAEWEAKEQEWIERLIREGVELLNVSSGGCTGKWMKTYRAWDEPPVPREAELA